MRTRAFIEMSLILTLALGIPAWAQDLKPQFAEDQVTPDNLSVVGNACVGISCFDPEPYGEETLKLKKDAVRLLFEDTSTGAGFPSTDWRLTVNDRASGGINRFSIEDMTFGSTPFTIMGSAPNNSLVVQSNGRVGIGTASPDAKLDIEATGSVEMRFTLTGSNVYRLVNDFNGFGITFVGSGLREFNLGGGGNVTISGMLTQGSSRDIKDHFATLDPKGVLAKVSALPLSQWSYKTDGPSVRHLGPMAEDFHKAFGLGADDKHVAPSDQAGVALLAVQGLNQVVQEKDREIADLKGRLEALERIVEALAKEE